MTNFRRPYDPLLLGLLILAGCADHRPASEEAPLDVSVAQLKSGKALSYEEFTGRTAAIPIVDIKARATGYLDKVLFTDGDDVKSGQLLYEIDPRTYKADVKTNLGIVANTEASLKLAKANLARAEELLPAHAVSKQDYDTFAAQTQQYAAQLQANQATLERAELNLGFCKVYAPITGRISRTNIQAGNLVTADQTTLTTLVSMDPIYAYFDVDEQTLLRVQQIIREEVSDIGIKDAREYFGKQKLDEGTIRQAVELLQSPSMENKRAQLSELVESKLVRGLGANCWPSLTRTRGSRAIATRPYRSISGAGSKRAIRMSGGWTSRTIASTRRPAPCAFGEFSPTRSGFSPPIFPCVSACPSVSHRPRCSSPTPPSSPTWTANSCLS